MDGTVAGATNTRGKSMVYQEKEAIEKTILEDGVKPEHLRLWDSYQQAKITELMESDKTAEEKQRDQDKLIKTAVETLKKRHEVRKKLQALGCITPLSLQSWDNQEISLKTLQKYEPLPTAEELQHWASLPKNLQTLASIKFPLLVGWSAEEVIEALAPTIGKHTSHYRTHRTDLDDCKQHGAIGVLNALRRDAGKQPFGGFAYLQIRTAIRRPAATSQLVKDTERRPSTTEVRQAVTAWLSGTLYEYLLERGTDGGKDCSGLSYKDAKKKNNKKALNNIAKATTLKVNELVEKHFYSGENHLRGDRTMMEEIIGAVVRLDSQIKTCKNAEDKKQLKGERERLIGHREGDFILCRVQKEGLGKAGELCWLVQDSFRLSRMEKNDVFDLCDFLNDKFCPSERAQHTKELREKGWLINRLFPNTNSDKTRTVADLVTMVASAPDFQGAPVSWSVPLDDGSSLDECVQNSAKERMAMMAKERNPQSECPAKERMPAQKTPRSTEFVDPKFVVEDRNTAQSLTDLVQRARCEVKLEHNQETVMLELFGCDSPEVKMKTGSYIAKFFGALVMIHGVRVRMLAANNGENRFPQEELDGMWSELCDLLPNQDAVKPELDADFRKKVITVIGNYTAGKLKSSLVEYVAGVELKEISRQRVTQYSEAITKKMTNVFYELKFETNHQDMVNAYRSANFTDFERFVAARLCGLDGEALFLEEELHRDLIVNQMANHQRDKPSGMTSTDYVKATINLIKTKMLAVVF